MNNLYQVSERLRILKNLKIKCELQQDNEGAYYYRTMVDKVDQQRMNLLSFIKVSV